MSVGTHVPDSVLGRPATGIAVRLYAGQALLVEGYGRRTVRVTRTKLLRDVPRATVRRMAIRLDPGQHWRGTRGSC